MGYSTLWEELKVNPRCSSIPKTFWDQAQLIFEKGGFNKRDKIQQLLVGDDVSRAIITLYLRHTNRMYEVLVEKGYANQETREYIANLGYDDIVKFIDVSQIYFENLDSLIDNIDRVGLKYGFGSNDQLQLKSICVLAWYGVSYTEMIELRKGNLSSKDQSVTVGDREIHAEPDHFAYLHAYANADKVLAFPNRAEVCLKDSPYLFRSHRKEKLDTKNLSGLVGRFNQYSHWTLRWLNINLNSKFCKIWEGGDNSIETVQSIMGYNIDEVYWYRGIYLKWVKTFHPEGGLS